jgi:transcriptional regulator with XRE-family HTH domain
MVKKIANPVQSIRDKIRDAADASGLTHQEIGERMGMTPKDARKAVSRLLNSDEYDPRLSTLLKLAEAIGRSLKDFL